MRTAIFCYAAPDAQLARALGAYLETNLAITGCYDECVIRPVLSLLDAAGQALSAEVAVILLSPESVPKTWDRAAWEPVLIEQPRETKSQLLFVLARACKFPPLLRRQGFADASQDVLAAQRELKRLILHYDRPVRNMTDLPPGLPEGSDPQRMEALRLSLADRPGFESGLSREAALQFAHACKEDFEGVFWIDCSRRTRAGILADVSYALGLRLSGSVEQNERTLLEFCAERRMLFLFEHLQPGDEDVVRFQGRSSVIVTAPGPMQPLLPLPETAKLFRTWTENPERCLPFLGDACGHIRNSEAAAEQLGPPVLALLKNFDRLAEAHEILDVLIERSRVKHDADTLSRLLWEESWILGHWGEPYNAMVIPLESPRETVQLGFDFLQ